MRRWILLIITSFLCLSLTHAQTRKITGKVISSEDHEPIMGASVVVKKTTIGTSTNLDGAFSLNVPVDEKTLVISFLGMVTKEVTIGAQSEINVILDPSANALDEVIVVAYGTAKKASFTGAAGQVNADKLENRPLTTATAALLGSMPGVQVSSANGQPGSASSIYIRGIGSFAASNTPLIVVNGVPYDNAISSINPSDVESISVLKDASSSALYGARGGNGVILIQTKTGHKDRTSVNVKFNQGFTSRQSKDYETLSLEDYLLVYWENGRNQILKDMKAKNQPIDYALAGQNAAKNLIGDLRMNPFNVPDDQIVNENGKLNPSAKFMWGDDTDWLNAIQQLGDRTEATVSVSGGSPKADYYLSVGYLDEKGYIIGSQFNRYTMNTNINSQITSFLKVGGTLSGNMSNSIGEQTDASGGNSNPFRFTRYIGPIYPIHLHYTDSKDYILDQEGKQIYDFGGGYKDESGQIVAPSRGYIGGNNPALELQNIVNGFKRNTLNAKAYAEIRFLNGFKFTANAAVGANAYLRTAASLVYPEKGNVGDLSKTNSFTTNWTFNQLLTYSKNFNKHSVDLLLGHESYEYEYNYLYALKSEQKVDGIYELGNYTLSAAKENSYTDTYRTEGYLARANYDYANRYFLSASVRRDASSRFFRDVRWETFYSAGAGWRIDQEPFIKSLDLKYINLLKLRISYGEVGNDDIGTYYAWQSAYVSATNGTAAGYIRDQDLNSRETKWEKSQSMDVALEFELFKKRLSGSVEYFNRQSSNLLFNIPQAPDTGISTALQNSGNMYNRGVEIDIHGVPIQTKDWIWDIGFNATFLKNKITKLPVEPYNSGMHRIEGEHSRYEFYLYQWQGINPKTGSSLYIPTEAGMKNILAAVEAEPDPAKWPTTFALVDGTYYTTRVTDALRDWSGNSTPSVAGGINSSLSWKGIRLSLLFNYQMGGKIYDSGYNDLMVGPSGSASSGSTRHVDILKRWQKEGDITNVPRIDFNDTDGGLNSGTSTRWLVSSDMLELANVILSYDIPKPWLSKFQVQGLRLYASGDNMLLFTARQGIYPRRNIFSGYSSNPDVYLPARVFTFGLNLTF